MLSRDYQTRKEIALANLTLKRKKEGGTLKLSTVSYLECVSVHGHVPGKDIGDRTVCTHAPQREAGNVDVSPHLESQGCHLTSLYYLLPCSSA